MSHIDVDFSHIKCKLYLYIFNIKKIIADYGFNYTLKVIIAKNQSVEIFLSDDYNNDKNFFYLYAIDEEQAIDELSYLENLLIKIIINKNLKKEFFIPEFQRALITKDLKNKLEKLSDIA